MKTGYCLNVHPGENLANLLRSLRFSVSQVVKEVGAPTAVGLWLSAQTVSDLQYRINREKLVEALGDLQVLSLNGFPFGNFHSESVKKLVYQPDWTESSRRNYTLDLFVLANLFGWPKDLGISTLPLSYKTEDPLVFANSAQKILQVVSGLDRMAATHGTSYHLDLEPEPGCLLETAVDVVQFFKKYLIPEAKNLFAERTESVLREHLRVCLDVCHAAVVFADPVDCVKTLNAEGIGIGKVQVSSAPKAAVQNGLLPNGTKLVDSLASLSRDRYLHQLTFLSGEEQKFFDDIPEAIAYFLRYPPTGEIRFHYHVPISNLNFQGFGTTQAEIINLLQYAAQNPFTSTWEVETYTWPGFEESHLKMMKGIADEILWLRNQMQTNTRPHEALV